MGQGLVHDLNTVFAFHVEWVWGLVHDLSILFVGRPRRNVGRQDGMLGGRMECWEAGWNVGRQDGMLGSRMECWEAGWNA